MKKTLSFKSITAIICMILSFSFIIGNAVDAINSHNTKPASASNGSTGKRIILQLNNPVMNVNGTSVEIDPGTGVAPIVKDARTLVPVRKIVEEMGGTVEWNQAASTAILSYNGSTIKLIIDSSTAYLNDAESHLDVAPIVLNGRTMLPIRFIAEGFGFDVRWDSSDSSITITSNTNSNTGRIPAGTSQVFMTTDISPDGLKAVYQALNRPMGGRVAIKVHMGELGNTNYLSPDLLKDLVLSVNGTFIDSNTYYEGSRSSTVAHFQTAYDHGFMEYAPVDVLDADGAITLPIEGGTYLSEAIIGSHYRNYDSIISIAHFKGHDMAGFGGTFKNLAVGMATPNGKKAIHLGAGADEQWSTQDFLINITDYTKAVMDDMGNNIVYINVLNNISVDCDCFSNAAKPEMADIGILASLDPVALDKASVDLIYAAPDGQEVVERIESRNGMLLLDYAEQSGLGSQKYVMVRLDG